MLIKPKILILAADNSDVTQLKMILADSYNIYTACDDKSVLDFAREHLPEIILIDVFVPGIDGFSILEKLKTSDATVQDIPVMIITALEAVERILYGLQLGAADYIIKPFNVHLVKLRCKMQIEFRKHIQSAEQEKHEAEFMCDALISAMALLAELRDTETGSHIQRVRAYARLLAEQVSVSVVLSKRQVEIIALSALVHDIGKVGISDEILHKTSRLTEMEFEQMKMHTVIGGDVIRKTEQLFEDSEFLQTAGDMIEFHHEKWDGSGYPQGLIGDKIPLSARIMAVVDVYDALTSKRIYKQALNHDEARKIILAGSGKHFAPFLIECFLAVEEQFRFISSVFLNMPILDVPRIDQEHQHMVRLHEQLLERQLQIISLNKKYEYLRMSLEELLTFFKSHYIYEEQLMQQYNYPNYKPHSAGHKKLVEQLLELLASCAAKQPEVFNKAMFWSIQWITSHVEIHDRLFADFIRPLIANK